LDEIDFKANETNNFLKQAADIASIHL